MERVGLEDTHGTLELARGITMHPHGRAGIDDAFDPLNLASEPIEPWVPGFGGDGTHTLFAFHHHESARFGIDVRKSQRECQR